MAPHRRRFLTVCGLAVGGSIAGCSGPDAESGREGETAGGEEGTTREGYSWREATFDAYWYSLYNMSTNIAMSGNGILFPQTEEQRQQFTKRMGGMLRHADVEKPPVRNPNLNMLPFTRGDPHFTQRPVLNGEDGRPDAATLRWDSAKSSGVVSPAALAWTHLKGITWAKNFEDHFDLLPQGMAPKFRAQVLSSLAQIGTVAALVNGGPEENGLVTKNPEKNLLLVSGVAPANQEVVDGTPRPTEHAAMLWFLSDLNSLAQNGWFGYVNPKPLIPSTNIQKLTNGMGKTVMNAFSPAAIVEAGSTRDLGVMLAAIGWFGTQTNRSGLRSTASDYANRLAAEVEANRDGSGRLATDGNLAAAQGIVGQGLTWASQLDGVDHTGTAESVLGYLLDELWDDAAGTFADGTDSGTYTISIRDAGDVTGGLNAADAELGMDVRQTFARFFDETFNRGHLQRAERPPSHSDDATHPLPLPPAAGGEYGQAAVYNAEVTYDVKADEWTVTDDIFDTAGALYTANQDIWIGNWAGDFYRGRGVPGKTDDPPG